MAGITDAPVDLGGKGDIPADPRSGFVHFIILQFGAGHYSLAKGRKKTFKKINEDSEAKLQKCKAHQLALELKIKRGVCGCGCLTNYAREGGCFHSSLSGNNNHNVISRIAKLVSV